MKRYLFAIIAVTFLSLFIKFEMKREIRNAFKQEIVTTTCGHCGKKMAHIVWYSHYELEHKKG